ncbi:MAG TPA: molecular chaperone [Burkholderiales bacterium]|nr:molecular chaperone [Burkholderiales bacterium]
MHSVPGLKFGRGIVFFLMLLCSRAGIAGSFEVNPIRIDLSAHARSAALSVRNSGADPVVVQASIVSWTQEHGQDVYTPTKEILITPPIATIQPGAEQIERLGMRRAPDAVKELAYRVFLQEVPPPPKPGFQGLQVALRLSLPVFVQPREGKAKATLVWNLELQGDDTLHLQLDNKGTGHIQVSEVALFQPGQEKAVASQSSLVYVLAGQSHSWTLKAPTAHLKPTDHLRLKVTTDAGSLDTAIDLGSH